MAEGQATQTGNTGAAATPPAEGSASPPAGSAQASGTPPAQNTPAGTTPAQGAPDPAATGKPAESQASPAAAKADGDKTTDSKEKASQPAKTAPEKYELKLPEKSLLSPDRLKRIEEQSRSQGLSNEQAQAKVNEESEAVSTFQESQMKAFGDLQKTWIETAQNDAEIGGQAFKENVELAKRAIEKFATPEFKKALDDSGFGNQPELLRTFVRIGRALGEDKLVIPGSANTEQKTTTDILYDHPTSQQKG